ncbi:MAG: diacylglycerol kinase [Oscillospiraceae bacterium]|nr:diacylglycerol kinase [Ruminococcus sp.]MDD7337669.1 diacylglycerol kinase [Ruminococcus sp.]MDY6061607.1 diacylglycerol kinase [Oscillospiraceae bacterium]
MKAFIKGFGYAFRGIAFGVINERNMRFHVSIFIYMMFFLLHYDFFEVSKTQFAILLMMSSLVMAGELFNTGIERAADAATLEKNEFVKIAKDAAAGAVLVLAIFSVAVGIIILYQPSAFTEMFCYFKNNPLYIAVLAVTLILDGIFILSGPKKIINFIRGKHND